MVQNDPDRHERAAAGLDFDGQSVRDGAASLGSRVIEEGPEVLLDEIENLLPEPVKEQVRQFPVVAMLLGVGIGVWLGMKKSDEIIAAGTSFVSAAALANVSQVVDRFSES